MFIKVVLKSHLKGDVQRNFYIFDKQQLKIIQHEIPPT